MGVVHGKNYTLVESELGLRRTIKINRFAKNKQKKTHGFYKGDLFLTEPSDFILISLLIKNILNVIKNILNVLKVRRKQ